MDMPNIKPSKHNTTKDSQASLQHNWALFKEKAAKAFKMVGKAVRGAWHDFLKSFARWADPRLEPYREHKLSEQNHAKALEKVVVQQEVYVPREPEPPATREDLFSLIRETPITILNGQERKAMMAVLSLPDVLVSEVMTIEQKIVFVEKDEVLGPLILDKLYRSGFTYFPVVEGNRRIIGTLQTALLNSLDDKETRSAKEVMDPRVYYIRADYTLEQALKAFLRTGSQMMMAIDRYEKLVGMLTFTQVMNYLFDEKFTDSFDRDDDRLAVAKRKD